MTTAIKSNATSGEILVNGVSKLTIGETTPPTTTAAQGAGANELTRKDYVDTPPAFYVHQNASTNVPNTNVLTQIAFQVELLDSHNWFASNRFTPQLAGWYQINAGVSFGGSPIVSASIVAAQIRKNGTSVAISASSITSASSGFVAPTVSTLVFLNGTTDFVDVSGQQNSTTTTNAPTSGVVTTNFSGHFVRSA